MKFLLDVCVAPRVPHDTLVELGHDVLSARDGYADASDRPPLAVACREGRVLVTEDKDFGELVFALRKPHPGIVRLDGLTAVEEAAAMRSLIEREDPAMHAGAIIAVTGSRIRIRSAENIEKRKT